MNWVTKPSLPLFSLKFYGLVLQVENDMQQDFVYDPRKRTT